MAQKKTLLIIDGLYAFNGAMVMSQETQMIDWLAFLSTLCFGALENADFYQKYYMTYAPKKNSSVFTYDTTLAKPLPDGPGFTLQSFKRRTKRLTAVDPVAQKSVDVAIATLLLQHAYENRCDQVVVFGRSADYAAALAIIRDHLKKPVYVVGFRGTLPDELCVSATTLVFVDEVWDLIQMPVLPELLTGSFGEDRRKHHPATAAEALNLPSSSVSAAVVSSGRKDSSGAHKEKGNRRTLAKMFEAPPTKSHKSSRDLLTQDDDEERLDPYEESLIKLLAERSDRDEASDLAYRLAAVDKTTWDRRLETEDHGILIAEDRNRRQASGRLTLEEEENDRLIAEALQKDILRGKRR